MKPGHFSLIFLVYFVKPVVCSSDSVTALVGCGACQGVQAKDFMCEVSCEVLGQKGE